METEHSAFSEPLKYEFRKKKKLPVTTNLFENHAYTL